MDLSIIIIEYNSIDEIRAAVLAFQDAIHETEFEIIISSNSCYPPTQHQELRDSIPLAKWIFNEKNGGFAYGMNQGMKQAKGDFLLISNPDVRLKTPLKPALEFMKQHPEVGALGAQILDTYGNIQDSCRNFMWPVEMICRQMIRLITSKDVLLNKRFDYEKIQPVDWVIGAFILTRRNVYNETKGLDEGYFLYVEDMDWNYRIHKAGYQVFYFPEVQIEYKGDRKSTKAFFRSKLLISHYGWEHLKSYCRFLYKVFVAKVFTYYQQNNNERL